ncbi:hypothetical protein CDN99_20075 [Roseateles aquatilis]|uniref:Uncharacterized protein n=1 Tax=Roseateles aquatilis TaxID=431061 RepID=A0A246J327_9BURK|nr:hypothetical protein [Roseateles aquatilis]OWQ86996.1 hypothetical protein CDN99_20075 [Roseateles aquatilis]
MTLRIPAIVSCLLTFSAVSVWAGSGNNPQEVISVGIHDTGHAIIEYAATGHSETCATPGHEKLVLIEKTDPRFKYLYATALAAPASGKKLNGWVDGCVDLWGDGRVRIPKALTLGLVR